MFFNESVRKKCSGTIRVMGEGEGDTNVTKKPYRWPMKIEKR